VARRFTIRVQLSLTEDMTSSTAHAGNSSRPCPSWPDWAPGLRPEGSLLRRGGDEDVSALGGLELLRELRFSLRSS
jgi:hypothetical protein